MTEQEADDILQEAHFLFVKKQYAEARELVDGVRDALPDHRRARELQDKIAAVQVQAQVDEEQRTGWLEAFDWTEGKAKGVLIVGILLIVAALLSAIPVFREAGQGGGLDQEILVVTRRGSQTPFHAPLHLLLLRPALMLIFGGGMAWTGYRYLREFH